MKRFTSLLISLLLAASMLALVACGGGEDGKGNGGGTSYTPAITVDDITIDQSDEGVEIEPVYWNTAISEPSYTVTEGGELIRIRNRKLYGKSNGSGTATVKCTTESNLETTFTVKVTAGDPLEIFNAMGTFENVTSLAASKWKTEGTGLNLTTKDVNGGKQALELNSGTWTDSVGGAFSGKLSTTLRKISAGEYTFSFYRMLGTPADAVTVSLKLGSAEAVEIGAACQAKQNDKWFYQYCYYFNVESECDLYFELSFDAVESAGAWSSVDDLKIEKGRLYGQAATNNTSKTVNLSSGGDAATLTTSDYYIIPQSYAQATSVTCEFVSGDDCITIDGGTITPKTVTQASQAVVNVILTTGLGEFKIEGITVKVLVDFTDDTIAKINERGSFTSWDSQTPFDAFSKNGDASEAVDYAEAQNGYNLWLNDDSASSYWKFYTNIDGINAGKYTVSFTVSQGNYAVISSASVTIGKTTVNFENIVSGTNTVEIMLNENITMSDNAQFCIQFNTNGGWVVVTPITIAKAVA